MVKIMKNAPKKRREQSPTPLYDRETVILEGNRTCTVYGCEGILRYGGEEILLRLGRTRLRVVGKGLSCASFCGNALTVRGRIDGVQRVSTTEEAET